MRSLVAAGYTLFVCACACRPPEGGLEVEVKFEGFKPACLEVVVTDVENAQNSGTEAVTVTTARPYVVGVAPGKDWGRKWRVLVAAREASCTGKVITSQTDAVVEIPVGAPQRRSYTLTATDSDGDGYPSIASGGTDCDDTQPMSSPGLAENCSDNIDNDCSGSRDCMDPACLGQQCSDGNACTEGDVCTATGCNGTARNCGAPTQPCRQADAGRCEPGGCFWPLAPLGTPCGAGMACNSGGVCVPGSFELNCSDGLDDDNDDAGIDCEDSDCDTVACDAGRCVSGATCQARSCTGAPVVCSAPGLCRDAGTCNPSTGACDYPLVPAGTACTNDACFSGRTCDATGTCGGGAAMSCPGGVCQTGFCDGGACFTAPANGGSCNDDAGCTHSDTCIAGACLGTPYSCAVAPACQVPAVMACLGDGGCSFVPNAAADGTRCDAGSLCQGGSCVPAFPYAPSNIADPTLFPPAGDVTVNCFMGVNTDDAGTTFANWCGGPRPNVYQTVQEGSTEPVMVLSMRSLRVTNDGGVLYFFGRHTPLLLVFDPGTTTLSGLTTVQSINYFVPAGANHAGCGVGQNGVAAMRGSGGGGGGWLTGGTRGGAGDGAGGDGGTAIANPSSYTPLLGGCSGGSGGAGPFGDGGSPGGGGGALQISVAGELQLGYASASGGGGGGAPLNARAGGGGGGSGGVLLLEARRLNLSGAWLTANGGAGGEGSDDNEPGNPGQNGYWNQTGTANGGTGAANNGGNGGDGAAGTTGPSAPTAGGTNGGGGGGAGAVGRIFLRAQDGGCPRGGANFSPPFVNVSGCN